MSFSMPDTAETPNNDSAKIPDSLSDREFRTKCCMKAPPGLQTPLNPDAPLWEPTVFLTFPQSPEQIHYNKFLQAFRCVVEKVGQEIEGCVSVPVRMHVIRLRRVWSIICRVREEDMDCRDVILQSAKEYILSEAKAFNAVHLIGCCRELFRDKTNGFTAIWGSMNDENMACWNLYDTRSCVKESCHWQHPLFRLRLAVLVKKLTIDTPSTPDADVFQ